MAHNNWITTTTAPVHTHVGNIYTISNSKTTYTVLGEEITIDGYNDYNMAILLSQITILGKPFYNELLKNGIKFPKEITDFLNIKFRDQKIDDILNK